MRVAREILKIFERYQKISADLNLFRRKKINMFRDLGRGMPVPPTTVRHCYAQITHLAWDSTSFILLILFGIHFFLTMYMYALTIYAM